MERRLLHVHLALGFVQLSFGAFHVFGKAILEHFDPLVVAGLRVAFALPVLMILALWRRSFLPERKDLPYLALLGLFGVFANQLLYIQGLSLTSATHAGILMPSIPIFAQAFGILLRIERTSLGKILGIILAIAGALAMLRISDMTMNNRAFLGDLLILVNCMSYALFLVFARPVLTRLPALTIITWTYLFGGLGILAVTSKTIIHFPFETVPTLGWAGIAYIVVIPSTLNYFLNTWGVKHSTPTLVATYITLQPVAAALMAFLALGERLSIRDGVGFALIIAGLFLVSKSIRNRS